MPDMVQTTPLSLNANGSLLALVVPAIANMGAPTMAEVSAGTVVDISCYLTAIDISITENSVEDTRLCTKQVFAIPGDYSEKCTITYTYNPPSAVNDKARLGLTEGVVKFLVLRFGIDADTAIATGDFVDVRKFRAGKQQKNSPARNSNFTITQELFISAITRYDVTVAA